MPVANPNPDALTEREDEVCEADCDGRAERVDHHRDGLNPPIVRLLLLLAVAMLCMSPEMTPQLCGTALQISSLIG